MRLCAGGHRAGIDRMLDVVLRRGGRVLLPVARTTADDSPVALQWGEYRPGQLVAARFGLLEPARPWLPTTTLAEASVVLVPALAVDRAGVRLGRGRGFYDRTLVHRDPRARLIAVIRDRGAARRVAARAARRVDDACADSRPRPDRTRRHLAAPQHPSHRVFLPARHPQLVVGLDLDLTGDERAPKCHVRRQP